MTGSSPFLALWPGLASRILSIVTFAPYTSAELAAIFSHRAGEAGFTLTSDAAARVSVVIGRPCRAVCAGSLSEPGK